MEKRFKGGRYAGELRLIEKELDVNYGSGRTIFIEHCNDMWAEGVPDEWIERILDHCNRYPENEYIYQTKNPARYHGFLSLMPPERMLGCTVETIDAEVATNATNFAPLPTDRLDEMDALSYREKTFITIEPIFYGNMDELALRINGASPGFVNIGADSKGTGLDEPSGDDVRLLISELNRYGVEIKQKTNLDRLLK
jgi:protein gp37